MQINGYDNWVFTVFTVAGYYISRVAKQELRECFQVDLLEICEIS